MLVDYLYDKNPKNAHQTENWKLTRDQFQQILLLFDKTHLSKEISDELKW